MSKLSLQFKLLDILIDGRIHSAKELQIELGIKNSSLRWHIDSLIMADFQIESYRGVGGGYKLEKDRCKNNILQLMEKEI